MALPQIAPYDLPLETELPPARGPWVLQRDRAALLVHDMQNYFLRVFERDTSPLAPAIANIARLAAACRSAGIPVFYTAQNGDQDRRDRGLQADIWGPGMTSVPEHQAIVSALAPEPSDIVLVKHRYSAFQRSNLETLMRARGRDQIVICGVYGHIGCMLTAAEAFQRDVEAFFVADAIADFSRDKHDLAVTYIADRCGVPMSTRQAIAALEP